MSSSLELCRFGTHWQCRCVSPAGDRSSVHVGSITLPLSVGEREQGNIRLPYKKPPSNSITPWATGNPLGFAFGWQNGREQAAHHTLARLGKQVHTKPKFPGSSCIPIALWGWSSGASPVASGIGSPSAAPQAVLHHVPSTRTPGERISARGLFTSCWLWPWALFCALAEGLDPSGTGPGAAGAAPTDTQWSRGDLQALFQASGG